MSGRVDSKAGHANIDEMVEVADYLSAHILSRPLFEE